MSSGHRGVEAAVELSGDVALEAAADFGIDFSFCSAPGDVGMGSRACAPASQEDVGPCMGSLAVGRGLFRAGRVACASLIGWPCLTGVAVCVAIRTIRFPNPHRGTGASRDHRLLANYRSDADVRHIDGSN